MKAWQLFRKGVTALAAVCMLLSAVAGFAAETPDAGTALSGLQQNKPELQAKIPGPDITVEQPQPVPVTVNGPKIGVSSIRITGQDIYSEEQLLPLVQSATGQELSLAELEAFAGKVARYFHEHGYMATIAYVPEQDITAGVVEIKVLVGRYGKINIRSQSRLDAGVAAGLAGNLRPGSYVRQQNLERTLLLFNDLGGVQAKGTLAAGERPGTSDLSLDITDTPRTSGYFYTDNWGNRYTGSVRAGFEVALNNPGGRGDIAGIGGLITNKEMNDYNLSYLLPVGHQGVKLGAAHSKLHYNLGEDFAVLDAYGTAQSTLLYASYPFVRSRGFTLTGQIGYEQKRFQDKITHYGIDSRKQANVWVAGLSGESRDEFGGGGITQFAATYINGHLRMQSADAHSGDADAKTAGSYSKTHLRVTRTQYLSDRLNLYLMLTGQFAGKNLDSAEKLSLGGANGVRAYPQGEAYGDEGYILSSELRWQLPQPDVQLAAFFDTGNVTVNKNPWAGAGPNKKVLSGAGLGLIWAKGSNSSIRLDYAWKLSSYTAVSDNDKNGRFWLQGIRYF